MQGNTVLSIADTFYSAGQQNIAIDASALVSGRYACVIESKQGARESIPLIIQK